MIDYNSLVEHVVPYPDPKANNNEALSECCRLKLVSLACKAAEASLADKHADTTEFINWVRMCSNFVKSYESLILNTHESLLAETVILALSIAKSYKYVVKISDTPKLGRFKEEYDHLPVEKKTYYIVYAILYADDLHSAIENAIFGIQNYCKYHGIDLMLHIKQKLEYDEKKRNTWTSVNQGR